MNVITKAMSYFGIAPPFHDIDLPDEPSARPELRALHCADQSPRLGRPGVGGPAAPESSGAAGIHPSQWPTDDVSDALRDAFRGDLAHLRSVLREALVWLDEIDPTPHRLAALADVTDISTRKGRPSHP